MTLIKNIHFSILIKIDGRLREFNFRKRSESRYDADTSDEQGKRWSFTWLQEDGNWTMLATPVTATLPSWLLHNTASIRESFLTETL